MSLAFQVIQVCPSTRARLGQLVTSHGAVETPAFMPVGSQATVKTLTPQEVKGLGASIVLANAYHLYLRPGIEVVARLGGLHRFMAWDGPILTDSGGFQVFSLGHLVQVNDEGAWFRSHIDGSPHFWTPEKAIAFQEELGADIIMAFDECPPYGPPVEAIRRATERTHLWARRCQEAHRGSGALFAIAQGGTFPRLLQESASNLAALGFEGYGIGGLCLGEPKEVTYAMIEATVAHLPADRPRYLMGVGSPEDLVEGVARGVDLFDSALPTRVARNGGLYTKRGRLNIRNAAFREQEAPIEEGCDCYTCRTFSAAYLHHLFRCQELLAYRLATLHNLRFILRLMEEMRLALRQGTFSSFRKHFLAVYQPTDEEARTAQRERWRARRHAPEMPPVQG